MFESVTAMRLFGVILVFFIAMLMRPQTIAAAESPQVQEFFEVNFSRHKGDWQKSRLTFNKGEGKGIEKQYILTSTVVEEIKQPDGTIWCKSRITSEPPLPSWFPNTSKWSFVDEGWLQSSEQDFVSDPAKRASACKKEMKYPLRNGDTWQGEPSHALRTPCEPIPTTVSGPEDVTVAAGTFKALKIHAASWQGCSPSCSDNWYAPHIGVIKSQNYGNCNIQSELIAFHISD